MTTDWIEIAIKNGGRLSMRGFGGIIRAEMRWPTPEGEFLIDPVYVDSSNVESAIIELNDALRDDAADEMVKDGKA